jgi:RNA polymerase sigma-70 factor (ECF subfamily)
MPPGEQTARESGWRRAILAGDASAWRDLYDHAAPRLWAYVAWRCSGLHHLAEEIAQETWTVAVRRIRDFDPQRGTALAWLRGIAAQLLRAHFRRMRPSQPLDAAIETAIVMPDHADAEAVARTLAELPEHYEAVLRAKYLDRQSVADIARERGETMKAIESLLTRARQAFRERYQGDVSPSLEDSNR